RYPRCPRNISDNKGTTAPRCPAMAIRAVQQRTAPRTKFRDRSGGFSLATREISTPALGEGSVMSGRVIDPSVGLDAVAFVEVVREPALNGHTQASSRCPL